MVTADHRVRVAAERRERMRARLLESALLVFAERGLDATSIEDIIAAAGVSRGTFYNYFQTNEELMAALLEVLGRELITAAEVAMSGFNDPAERLATGTRMLLHIVSRFPLLGRFVTRVGIEPSMQNNLAMLYLPRDIAECVEAGYFAMEDIHLGVEFVAGVFSAGVYALTSRKGISDDYPEQIIYHALVGLGINKAKARKLVALPLLSFEAPADSLLARTGSKLCD